MNEEVVKLEEPSIQLTCGPDVVIIKDTQDSYTACPKVWHQLNRIFHFVPTCHSVQRGSCYARELLLF